MRTTLKNRLHIVAGTLFVALGVIGIIVPILPTTPFLLLAAACYLRGSERLHRALMTNRFFGQYLTNYLEGRGMPLRVKIVTISLLWTTIILSLLLLPDNLLVTIILLIVLIGVTIHLLTLKTFRG